MKAKHSIIFDGHEYKKGQELPDLGSLVGTGNTLRNYKGLSADISKLPTYDDLETGSTAYFIDTQQLFMYEKTTKQWIEQ